MAVSMTQAESELALALERVSILNARNTANELIKHRAAAKALETMVWEVLNNFELPGKIITSDHDRTTFSGAFSGAVVWLNYCFGMEDRRIRVRAIPSRTYSPSLLVPEDVVVPLMFHNGAWHYIGDAKLDSQDPVAVMVLGFAEMLCKVSEAVEQWEDAAS